MGKDGNKNESRRKFLKAAGKFAVYTPPALMIMSSANVHAISQSNGECKPGNGFGDESQCHSGPPGQDKT